MTPRATELERILTSHAPAVEAVVRRYADDAMDRDDLRQEIAIAVWRALPRFERHSSERTYVLRIARNRAVTFCLRRARARALFHPLDHDVAVELRRTDEHDLEHLHARFDAALDRLPQTDRQLLALAAAGVPPRAIAAESGRSAGAVRVALHRARAAVRRWVAGAEALS